MKIDGEHRPKLTDSTFDRHASAASYEQRQRPIRILKKDNNLEI